MKPLFSVVSVTKDDESGIRRTVESTLRQSLNDYEVIVVDGGASPESRWRSSLSALPNVKYRQASDRGVYDAMNHGLELAEGQLVIFLNGGDSFFDENVLARVRQSFERLRWHWAHGVSVITDVTGQPLRFHMVKPHSDAIFWSGLRSIPHQAVFARRADLIQLGGFDLTFGIAADQHMLARLALAYRPADLWFLVAICDNNGIGSQQPVDAFTRQMMTIRSSLGRQYGNRLADRTYTEIAARLLRARIRIRRGGET